MTTRTLNWRPQCGFSAVLIRGKRALTLTVGQIGDEWQCVAVETSKDAQNVEEFFDDHLHQSVSSHRSLIDALQAGTDYALQWRPSAKRCGCTEIQ